MPWRPSLDPTLQRSSSTPFWQAVQSIFGNAVPFEPQPRHEIEQLQRFYVRRRRGDRVTDAAVQGRLPDGFVRFGLGETDLDLLDFLLNFERDRILRLEGPRGAGKTSLIHFAEAALMATLPPEECPRFLIVNGNALTQGKASTADVVTMLRGEMQRRAESSEESYPEAFAAALGVLGESRGLVDCVAAMRTLVDRLPGANGQLVTLVFDNLDHHDEAFLDDVASLAKAIYIGSRVGTVVCMRPGSWGAVAKRPQYRAVITYSIEVHAPSVDEWLKALAGRIKAEVQRRASVGTPTGGYAPTELAEAFDRLVALLIKYRRETDDIFAALDAVSADDTRHLVACIRRILESKHLPVEWLLGRDGPADDFPSGFHPLQCLIEGSQEVFRGDKIVPNLLCLQGKSTSPEFLLLHRILRLLDGADANAGVETHRLLDWLYELEYEEDTVREALPVLSSALLIRSPDSERFGDGAPLPSELAITDAGRFYLNHMLTYPDYLTATVLDVPLEHELVSEAGPDSFAARLSSLLEYADKVRRLEDRQIQRLARRPPSPQLRRVAEAMLDGGLLTSSLVTALKHIERRSRTSDSTRLQGILGDVRRAISALQNWRVGADERLEQRVARGTKLDARRARPRRFASGNTEVSIEQRSAGPEVVMKVTAGESLHDALAIVALQRLDPRERVFSAGLLHAEKRTGVSPTTQTPKAVAAVAISESSARPEVDPGSLVPQILKLPPSLNRSQVGLLIVDEAEETFRLRLQLAGSLRGSARLSGDVPTEKTVKWCTERLESIAGMAYAGQSVKTALRSFGADLYNRLLSSDGQNTLAHYLRSLDTVIVCSRLLAIPWELMCPPAIEGVPQPALGDVWRMFRWTADPVDGLAIYYMTDVSGPTRPLRTVGLRSERPAAWRAHPEFDSYLSLRDHCLDAATLHLCGHWNQSRNALEICAVHIDAGNVMADGLPGPRNVLLSSCGAAAVAADTNVPLAITMTSAGKRVAWAPMVTIAERDAEMIDDALERFLAQGAAPSLEDFMREARSNIPLLSLYVRYGISRL